ncbi:hypothetical protein ACHAPU_009570 [Fusarium lateritium]
MVRNKPGEPFQRRVLVDRASPCGIRAVLVGVVHGSMGPNKEPATLLIFEFKFDARKRDRRIKSANITTRFYGEKDYPAVADIAPHGPVFLNHTITKDTTTVSPQINALGYAGSSGLGISTTSDWQSKDSAVLNASKRFKPKAGVADIAGSFNAVTWTMMENATARTGIPSYLQTAILLQRRTDEMFHAVITIEADVSGFSFRDFSEDILGDREDDPVVFNPRAPPQWPDAMGTLDLRNLGLVDLSSLSRWVDSADMGLPLERCPGR